MDFKTKWYSPENKPLEIPTFQDLQNVTGQAFDDFGNYVGKKEMPKHQLVIDKLTQRQYYAPEEYSEDAIRYGKAKIDESFKPKDWYGMTQIKPNYKFMEHISAGYISTLKSLIKPMAELPTKIVYTGAVGLNAISRGNFQSAETLYRSSMKNWEQTLDKAGLGADPELQDMLTVKIGSIAGQTASSLLMAAAVSSVGGLPAVAAVFGSQQFADVMEEGLAKGLSHKKAVSVAFQAAVAEGGLEAVGFRLWSGAASMNKSFRNIALGFLWEGAQEGSQQIAESAITNFYGLREQDLYEIMAEVALSALVGGLVGGVGAGLSGQVEQRNIALKKEIGMTEQGNIVTPNTEKKEKGVMLKPSKEAEKQFTDQEIAEAKRTGDNKLYNIIKNIANAHGITDEKIIDKIYPVCRKMVSDGATLSNLQDIIGQQVVAYKNQLDNNQIDKEANDKAVEQIKLVTDPNRVEEWRESRKSELEKIGFTKEQAGTLTEHLSTITQRLSERLGFDITKKKEISFSPNLSERAGTRGQIELEKTVAKVALNKNADPTTVEHEFFHYIDRVVLDAAKEGNVEAQKLVNKRDEIIKKAKAELKKRGIKDMPIDEEILASAYEKWLWQGGKSEDAYEQRLFNAIREFFREVYDTVKGLMGIRITPEADAYFRAMTGEGRISYQSAPDTLFQEGIKYDNNGKDLFATHNMSLTGTKQALKLGGLAMPSMAIRKTDTERVAEFGDISFVGNENLVKPSRSTEVYDRDAWTPSIYNNIKYRMDPKAKQFIMDVLKKNGKEKQWSMYQWNIQEKLSDISLNELALDLYLLDKGLKDSNRTEAWNSPEYASWYNEHFLDTATPYLYMENDDNTDMVERKLTLNNIMKLLRRQERASGGYIGDHLFSVQELIKFFPQKFRNLKELRAKKENLQDADRIYANIEELDNDFAQLVTSLRTSGQEKEYGADTQAVGLAVANHGDKEIQRRWLENAGLPSDDVTLAKVDAFAERMKNEIPVQYFEAKPRRVVEFGQFSGVIMPNTKEYDSLAEQLKTEYGLPVMRIEKGNVAQYKEALNTIQNMYPTTLFQTTQEELFRNDQALKEGNKVLDKAPTNEQVEKELENIRNQQVGDVVITKEGFGIGESIGDFVLTLRQRVGVIDKRLKYAFDRLDFNEKMRESNYGKRVVGFIKKYRKLTETQKQELDYLINNHLSERVREFARQNDMLAEYEEARTLLDELFEEGNKAGMDMGFLQEYFPTKVNDYEGLISYLKGTDKWSKIEMALNQIDPNHQMSEEDRANAINNILRGYNRLDPVGKKGFQKERKIFHKTPEIMKFYAHADEALMRYVSGMSSALSIRTAFNVKGAFSAADSIGGIVDELIKSGKITHKEEAFITKMLRARLNYARTAPMVALLKNLGYLGTMNNLTSAITQIGDLYANFYKYNFGTAMKALFGKSEVTKQDLHIDSIWEEFSDDSWSSVAVNKLFSAIGLNKMDAFGKNTSINGAWIDLKERLKNNDTSLLEDLTAAFGSGAKKVMEDIKNNNITEDVKLMIWSQLADTQPIGRSGVPVGYLNNPHGRIIYQLKTYTINQLSLFYADGIYKIKKGMATKNKKLFLQGIGNTAKLALLLTIFNAGADALKNLIMGRKIDISDTLLSNMLWNIGVSKYTFYRGQRDGYARALLENYLLPPQISMGDDAYMDIKKIATGKRKPSDTIAVTYVPFGRMWYWWFGGGRTQEKKKGNKPFEVEL